jgi:hypothetical protein
MLFPPFKSKPGADDFVFVGIHWRATDHIKYELEFGFVPVKTSYFLEAMDMYRQHFK